MARRRGSKRKQTLTPEEVHRAIALDFEGFSGETPTLVGIHEGHCVTWIGFDPALRSAFDAVGIRLEEPRAWARQLAERTEREGRRLIAFSPHERIKLAELGVEIDVHNTLPPLKRWRGATHPEAHGRVLRTRERRRRRKQYVGVYGNTLTDFARLIGRQRPTTYGGGRVTSHLRRVRTGLARHGTYEALPAGAKRGWTRVLHHNQWDCVSTAALAAVLARGEHRDGDGGHPPLRMPTRRLGTA